MRKCLATMILNIDDWFAKRKIYFTFGSKDPNHVSFLCKLGYWLWLGNKKN